MTRRYFVLVNPRSGRGNGRRTLERVRPLFERAGSSLSVQETRYPGHARAAVKSLTGGDYEALCVIGGDGTLHEVINGLMEKPPAERVPVGPIAAGSGNALLHDLGCLDPMAAAGRILRHEIRPIDIAEIHGPAGTIYGFNIVGWGFPAAATRMAARLRFLGGHQYTVGSLIELLRRKTYDGKISFEGQEERGRFLLVLGCLTRYTGKGMKAAPDAVHDDGLVDLIIVRAQSRLRLLPLFIRLFRGEHVGDPGVKISKVSEFSIVSDQEPLLNVDGELIAAAVPCRVGIRRRAVRLLV